MIRERSKEDLEECVAVLARVHREGGFPTHWPQDPAAWLTPANMVRAWVAAGEGEAGGRILGHVMVRETDGVTSLNRLFVAPEARGLGTGKALLDKVKQWAKEHGKRLVLEVNAEQAGAVRLYERNGWRRTHSGPASWSGEVTSHHYELVEVHADAPLPLGEDEQHRAPIRQ
jgi:GNAT superfamily N-acetyltransferase